MCVTCSYVNGFVTNEGQNQPYMSPLYPSVKRASNGVYLLQQIGFPASFYDVSVVYTMVSSLLRVHNRYVLLSFQLETAIIYLQYCWLVNLHTATSPSRSCCCCCSCDKWMGNYLHQMNYYIMHLSPRPPASVAGLDI